MTSRFEQRRPIMFLSLLIFLLIVFVILFFYWSSGRHDAELRASNSALAAEIATLRTELTELRAVNARLQADIEGGRTAEEERIALQRRAQELDRRAEYIGSREANLDEREGTLRRREQEFHEATNLTQQDIGRASQVVADYERMREERNAAQALANRWLIFIYALSIGFIALISTLLIIYMRYRALIESHRAEIEIRRGAVDLLRLTASDTLDTNDKQRILSAVSDIAAIRGPENDDEGKP